MIEPTRQKLRARDLKPSQRKALFRLVAFYRDRDRVGVESVRFRLHQGDGTYPMFDLWTRRSDCTRYSPRAFHCEAVCLGHFGPRGRIWIHIARIGLYHEEQHVYRMTSRRMARFLRPRLALESKS